MKKITIISYSFPPSNTPAAQRPYSIAKYLGMQGHDIAVLSCSNQDSSLGFNGKLKYKQAFRLYLVPGISLSWFRNKRKQEMVTTNVKGNDKPKKKISDVSKWIFPDKAISWFPLAFLWILIHPSRFLKSSIITSAPLATNHLLGLIAKKIYRPFWIADIRDFQYLNNHDQNPSQITSRLHSWLEKSVIKNADRVTLVSSNMLKKYSEVYDIYSHKFSLIYNGFDEDEFSEIVTTPKPNFEHTPIVIFYAGSFYKGVRSPLPLIKALQSLVESQIIKPDEILIEVAGNFENELQSEIKQFPISNQIRYLGILKRREVLKKMSDSHLLWLIIGDKANHSDTIPLKTFEYIGSRRPILCFGPESTETFKIISELDCGWEFSCNPERNDENIEILKQIFEKGLYTEQFGEELNIKIQRFTRRFQANEFSNIIN
ncbi:hypothetical protein BA6E_101351 [Bacteroidales bacterium 6E]|nr:hypothetical protein BA6E_101351 [Bacteroidales bacterium 6E]